MGAGKLELTTEPMKIAGVKGELISKLPFYCAEHGWEIIFMVEYSQSITKHNWASDQFVNWTLVDP